MNNFAGIGRHKNVFAKRKPVVLICFDDFYRLRAPAGIARAKLKKLNVDHYRKQAERRWNRDRTWAAAAATILPTANLLAAAQHHLAVTERNQSHVEAQVVTEYHCRQGPVVLCPSNWISFET